MPKPLRLDIELVRRGYAETRTEARRAIEEGVIEVAGMPVTRPAAMVAPGVSISRRRQRRFVSRGGEKLDGALARFSLPVEGRLWLDAGASTGGFTDRLIAGGARAVAAVDVGYGQLDWKLRNDARVFVLERTNVRTLRAEDLPWRPQGVVADLSFISLTLCLPALAEVATSDADLVLLVKPQFEVGRAEVSRGGVVRSSASWRKALQRVVTAGEGLDLCLRGAAPSRPRGPAGNQEFFVHLSSGGSSDPEVLEAAVKEAEE